MASVPVQAFFRDVTPSLLPCSHLQGMFFRTARMLEAGVKPVYVFDGMPPAAKKEELARRWAALDGASRAQLLPWSGLLTLCARELCLVSCDSVNNLHSCLQSCACAGLSGEERQQRTWRKQRRCRPLELHAAPACIRCEHGCGTMEPGTQQCCQSCIS
jgi:XPG N-terminal domain